MSIKYEIPTGGKKHMLGVGMERIISKERSDLVYANIKKPTTWKTMSKYLSDALDGDITVFIDPNVLENASADIPQLDNNNPFLVKAMIGNHKENLDIDAQYISSKAALGSSLLGGFDISKCKLTGWAKKLRITYTIGYGMLYPKDKNRITVEGCTSVMLHEIGHTFQMILGVGWSARTNFVLTQAHSRLMKVGSDSNKRIEILNEIASEEAIDIHEDINYLARSNDPDVPAIALCSAIRTNIRNELGSYNYDITGSESMADNFAANMGYGLPLAITLGKMANYRAKKAEQVALAVIKLSVIGVASLVIFGGSAVPALTSWAIIGSMYAWEPEYDLYDDPKDRVIRITNTVIGNLKRSSDKESLDKAEALLDEISYYPNDTRPILKTYYEFITADGRNAKNIRGLQKDLESLAQHKLYIKAIKFKNLAQ